MMLGMTNYQKAQCGSTTDVQIRLAVTQHFSKSTLRSVHSLHQQIHLYKTIEKYLGMDLQCHLPC